ncbi:hypothetical protein ACFQ78_38690 [Streptomyces sp. NPDC056519]|uniref:hypothetical protein n=1 Tax=Streptomyces sp. NPDC056519 TaxID=3345849 RepID=UPI0036B8EBAF
MGFKYDVIVLGTLLDIGVEVVRRNPAVQNEGFVPEPTKWWVVEQTSGTLMFHPAPDPRVRPSARQLRLTRLPSLHHRPKPASRTSPPPNGFDPPEASTAGRSIVVVFKQHPDQASGPDSRAHSSA